MPLAPYTTPALVRIALGVNAQDLRDDKIDVSTHRTAVREALFDISPTLPNDLETAMTAGLDGQARFRDLGEMVCTYTLAHLLSVSAPLFAPQKVQDDRTSVERVSDPFKDLRKNLADTLAFIVPKLKAAYLEINPGAVVKPGYAQPTMVAAVPLGTDPVTG